MAILIYKGDRDITRWLEALKAVDDTLDIRVYPEVGNAEEITFALTWPYPHGLWNDFPHLKAISSIGAGVSHILEDKTLDRDMPILKLTDSRLNQSMWEYLLATISYQAMQLHRYAQQQSEKVWAELPPRGFDSVTVGIYGLGSIGKFVAERLAAEGFVVKGFANSSKEIAGVEVYTPSEVTDTVMQSLDIVVSILPLTAQTEGFFDQAFFARLKKGATFINVGRGAQLIEVDLIEALESGQLSHAWLDVLVQEPLREDHPFWAHPQVSITPHIASITDPLSVAAQIVENYHAAMQGNALHNVVDREMGY